jgi:hypothetical protein
VQAEPPDAELLRKCTEFHRIDAEYRNAERALRAASVDESHALWKSCEETLWPLHSALADAIIATPALTYQGAKAKAAVLRLMMEGMITSAVTEAVISDWEPHERLAWSLVDDLTKEAWSDQDLPKWRRGAI